MCASRSGMRGWGMAGVANRLISRFQEWLDKCVFYTHKNFNVSKFQEILKKRKIRERRVKSNLNIWGGSYLGLSSESRRFRTFVKIGTSNTNKYCVVCVLQKSPIRAEVFDPEAHIFFVHRSRRDLFDTPGTVS